jgi:hypothetical protein
VTRLGEFSPNARLFALGIFWKMTEIAHNFGILFPNFRLCINFDKNGLGYILGDFFANSSGHPVQRWTFSTG